MTSQKNDLDENPYEPPESESAASSRTPSVLAWIGVIIAALVAGGIAFFVTCYGVFIFGANVNFLDSQNAFATIFMFLLLTLPFLAFIFTLVSVIRFGGRSSK